MGGVWTAIARCAVPTYFAISGYFNKEAGKKQLEKGINFLRIFLVLNLVWFGIYTLISYSPYKELARWAKLDVNSKNILKCLLFGSAFGNEYLWYLHAIGMVYVVVYFAAKSQLDKIMHSEKAFNPSCIEIGSLRALDFIIWVNGYESMNASGRLFP